ncbi:c-type cytochrome [Neoroseomonas soli]|uniref:C-type cytochrome n=1 Tax=Neoroseomonas soli TaxID=1081025 RepID=A0A9X9WUU2_9PROT|nr:c-type cytochrome [Neoroseomonas soli]
MKKEGGGIRGEFTPPDLLAAALAIAWLASPALAQDGRAAFETRCASCHAAETSAPPGPGPNLAGLSGRRIAGDARFDYSPTLRGASGTWTAERLSEFLDDPEEMFPGLWMGGNGVHDAATRRAIVDYLMR